MATTAIDLLDNKASLLKALRAYREAIASPDVLVTRRSQPLKHQGLTGVNAHIYHVQSLLSDSKMKGSPLQKVIRRSFTIVHITAGGRSELHVRAGLRQFFYEDVIPEGSIIVEKLNGGMAKFAAITIFGVADYWLICSKNAAVLASTREEGLGAAGIPMMESKVNLWFDIVDKYDNIDGQPDLRSAMSTQSWGFEWIHPELDPHFVIYDAPQLIFFGRVDNDNLDGPSSMDLLESFACVQQFGIKTAKIFDGFPYAVPFVRGEHPFIPEIIDEGHVLRTPAGEHIKIKIEIDRTTGKNVYNTYSKARLIRETVSLILKNGTAITMAIESFRMKYFQHFQSEDEFLNYVSFIPAIVKRCIKEEITHRNVRENFMRLVNACNTDGIEWYAEQEQVVVKNTLTVIVGPSGSRKSTIAALLAEMSKDTLHVEYGDIKTVISSLKEKNSKAEDVVKMALKKKNVVITIATLFHNHWLGEMADRIYHIVGNGEASVKAFAEAAYNRQQVKEMEQSSLKGKTVEDLININNGLNNMNMMLKAFNADDESVCDEGCFKVTEVCVHDGTNWRDQRAVLAEFGCKLPEDYELPNLTNGVVVGNILKVVRPLTNQYFEEVVANGRVLEAPKKVGKKAEKASLCNLEVKVGDARHMTVECYQLGPGWTEEIAAGKALEYGRIVANSTRRCWRSGKNGLIGEWFLVDLVSSDKKIDKRYLHVSVIGGAKNGSKEFNDVMYEKVDGVAEKPFTTYYVEDSSVVVNGHVEVQLYGESRV